MPKPSNAQRRAASLLLPPVDLRHLLPAKVRTQGPRPLCVPFSISCAHEAARSAPGEEVDVLAVEPLWRHAVLANAAGNSGTTIDAIAEAVADTGQPDESAWPYNRTLAAGTEATPATATGAPFFTTEVFDVPLAHDGIEDHVEAALSVGLPVVVVLEMTSAFENPNANGEIATPPLASPVGDYHAVTAVGASTNVNGDSRRLLIRNSWGPGWGAGGYGWLPYDYLVAFAGQAAAIDPRTVAVA